VTKVCDNQAVSLNLAVKKGLLTCTGSKYNDDFPPVYLINFTQFIDLFYSILSLEQIFLCEKLEKPIAA
jgi:hypothetical protein